MSTTTKDSRQPVAALRRLLTSPLVAALTTPYPVDQYVELIYPRWSLAGIRAEVVDVHHETSDSVTLTLRPTANWPGFRAGQYVRVTAEVDGVRRSRCYSLAGSQHGPGGRGEKGGTIELTVKAKVDGLVSCHLQLQARRGLVVALSPAEGGFTLAEQRPDRLLLISGGSGITPVMSMIRTLCDEGYDGHLTFLHYAPTATDVIYRRELAQVSAAHANVDVVLGLTRSSEGDLSGHFGRDHLALVATDHADAESYVCGPPALIDAVSSIWREDGLVHRLHVERFIETRRRVGGTDATGSVRFGRSDRAVANDGRTLLEQAEAAGLRPESGCRTGICHTCTRYKTAGQVRNLTNGSLSSSDRESIQMCISVPVGDVVVDL